MHRRCEINHKLDADSLALYRSVHALDGALSAGVGQRFRECALRVQESRGGRPRRSCSLQEAGSNFAADLLARADTWQRISRARTALRSQQLCVRNSLCVRNRQHCTNTLRFFCRLIITAFQFRLATLPVQGSAAGIAGLSDAQFATCAYRFWWLSLSGPNGLRVLGFGV